MADVSISNYIIGIILFTMVIVGGVNLINSARVVDDSFISDSQYNTFNNTFNQFDNLNSSINTIDNSISDSDKSTYNLGVIESLIDGAWNTLRNIGTSFNFMYVVFGGLSMFGIPSWVITLLSLIVIIIISFALYALIFQGRT